MSDSCSIRKRSYTSYDDEVDSEDHIERISGSDDDDVVREGTQEESEDYEYKERLLKE